METRAAPSAADLANRLSRRHLVMGWTGLLIFLALGIALEALHGFKAGYYLDDRNTSRRLMFTLAHSHGTLFSLVNIAFALCLNHVRIGPGKRLRIASFGLTGALVLMPLGFFLGGLKLYGGDPGLCVLLVPVGAALMLAGVGAFVLEIIRSHDLARNDVRTGETPAADPDSAARRTEKSGEKPLKKSPKR